MNQTELIKQHLESERSITPMQALKLYGIMRLSARILNLKHEGLNIITEIIHKGGKHFAKYTLLK